MRHKKLATSTAVEPTQAIVREFLDYYPETGELWWKWRARKCFSSDSDWKSWNTKLAGKPAGHISSDGYWYIGLLYKQYRAHRIIWLWMTGVWPDPEVDHDNQDRSDNVGIIFMKLIKHTPLVTVLCNVTTPAATLVFVSMEVDGGCEFSIMKDVDILAHSRLRKRLSLQGKQ